MRCLVALAFWILLASAPAWALQLPEYFPLDVGNTWVYRGSGTRAAVPLTIEITGTKEFNGQSYVLLHGLPGKDYWLREDDGSIYAYDPDQNQEMLWYAFRSPPDEPYETGLPGTCCRIAVVSGGATYEGPLGDFDNVLEIRYPGVFQVGIERELFVPNIGLVHRAQATGGPSFGTYDSIYARIGKNVFSGPELAFSLTLDRSVYIPFGPGARMTPLEITARITLRNTSLPVELTFPSGQIYDLAIVNENGDIVYKWSAGKVFTQEIISRIYGPGEANYVIVTPPLKDNEERPLPPGRYVAKAWLATIPGIDGRTTYSASVAFEVRWLR